MWSPILQEVLLPSDAAPKSCSVCGNGKAAKREHAGGAGTLASPAVRRIAREHGLDLASVQGTGPGGRVYKGALHGGPAPDRLTRLLYDS